MEELPTDAKIVVVEESDRTKEVLDKLEKFIDMSPTIEILSAVRGSLVDIKNILETQNQRLEKIDTYPLENILNQLNSQSENLHLAATRMETAVNNFRAKTLSIENAAGIMETRTSDLNEIAQRVEELASTTEKRNSVFASAVDDVSRLTNTLEEKTDGIEDVINSYRISKEEIDRSISFLNTIQDNLKDLKNEVFERNQYLNILLSDMGISKETMERSIKLLESGSLKLKETVAELDRKTDDILNLTTKRLEDLKKLRDVLYDDIAAVEDRVKKVQKDIDKQNKAYRKRDKRQTELLNFVKKADRKLDKLDRDIKTIKAGQKPKSSKKTVKN